MEKQFRELREKLLRGGVAPRHVRRYLSELSDHLVDLKAEEEYAGNSRSEAEKRAFARLGGVDGLANAMTSLRQFKSWSARAPWAAFSLGPLLLLGACYLIACTILLTGWKLFLPDASTPFVRILDERAMIYFGVGRMLFFGAPLFAGWTLALVAARQRLSSVWPILAGALAGLLGATAQVHASRVATDASGRVRMTFALGSSGPEILSTLFRALAIVGFALLPYCAWRLARRGTVSA